MFTSLGCDCIKPCGPIGERDGDEHRISRTGGGIHKTPARGKPTVWMEIVHMKIVFILMNNDSPRVTQLARLFSDLVSLDSYGSLVFTWIEMSLSFTLNILFFQMVYF